MSFLFYSSDFNQDVSGWNTSNVKIMFKMFYDSKFNKDISVWDVSKVEDMENMFFETNFSFDLTKWKPISLQRKLNMFKDSPAPIPYWAEAEDTPAAVRSYILHNELEYNLIDKYVKLDKIKL